MGVLITKTWRTKGPDIEFDCPRCGRKGGRASVKETLEHGAYLSILPFSRKVCFTTIRCGNCRKSARVPLSLSQVEHAHRELVTRLFDQAVAAPVKICVIVSLLFFYIPLFGLIFGIVGIAGTVRASEGWRFLAWIGFLLSATVVLVLAVAAILHI